ncbi:MAG: type II secretion system F family protein [Acidobacteriota bacterium]|nr:type II secretion system F family protein [Acidobacteriota bacterium]
MPEFLVKVADDRGQVAQHVENARSLEEARERYVQQGLLVYSVKPRGVLAGGGLRQQRRVKMEQFVIFNQQFVTLVRAGLPILMSLELLAKRQRDPRLKAWLENVRDRVRGGEVLSQAFEAQGVFPRIYTTTVLAGERSGNLEEVLTRYIAFERISLAFKKKLKASLIYPALLFFLVFCMLIYLITYVVPQFNKLYEGLNAQLPPVTVFMLDMGVAAQHYGLIALPFLLIGAFLLWRWTRSDSGGEWLDRMRLRVPLLGDIWLKYQVAMFARMMSTLLTGGLPLVNALETSANSMSSRLISGGIQLAAHRVREGMALSRSMEEAKVFPELAVEMTEVGESTGALPQMLSSAAEFYEEDVQTALSASLSLIEPVILIFMGVVVAFVLISLYMPIFSLGAAGQLH